MSGSAYEPDSIDRGHGTITARVLQSAINVFRLSNEAQMANRLNPDDQQRVDEYLQAPQHQVERRPFRPWLLLVVVVAATVGLGLLSRLVSYLTL